MYKDLRVAPSSPQHWAASLGNARRAKMLLAVARLSLGLDRRWRRMSHLIPAGGTILDAGCGQGTWLRFLRSRSFNAIGLDYSFPLLRAAQEQGVNPLILGSVSTIPLKDDACDGLISWGVIEHDEAGPEKALLEFKRVLRPGGYLFVTVPFDHPKVRRAFAIERANAERFAEELQFYQYLFTEAELADLLKTSGFEVLNVERGNLHTAVAFPRLYSQLDRLHPALRDILGRFTLPLAAVTPGSTLMLLAAAKRSES